MAPSTLVSGTNSVTDHSAAAAHPNVSTAGQHPMFRQKVMTDAFPSSSGPRILSAR
jgi:hypothetical protein